MADSGKEKGQHYEALKQRLWNKPRPRQILEQLEQDGAPAAILEAVALKFTNGQDGEAEVRAAIYSNLFRHRNRAALVSRLASLRFLLIKISHDLIQAAGELQQLKDWEAYRILEHGDWAEFALKELSLSAHVAGALMMARKSASLDEFLQRAIKGYAEKSQAPGQKHKPNGKRTS